MKRMEYGDIEWSTWFQALDTYEQEWFSELLEKRRECEDQLRGYQAELHRVRQRGQQRRRRQELAGTA